MPGDDPHFVNLMAAEGEPKDDPEAIRPDGSVYPRREVFGRYVNAHIAPLVDSGCVEHVQDAVADVRRSGERLSLRTTSGAVFYSDSVVNATTHPPPSPPDKVDAALAGHPRYVPDSNAPGALDAIRPGDRVLVIGTGLTAADIVASLTARGHHGPITTISRRGLRSRGHAPFATEPFGDFTSAPFRTARSLLAGVRRTVRDAEASGLPWHPVFDALRLQGLTIWRVLPTAERRRLVRHLRSYWGVHRFQIAPQVEAVIDAGLASGRIKLMAARIMAVAKHADGSIVVEFRPTGGRAVARRPLRCSRDCNVTCPWVRHRGATAPEIAGACRASSSRRRRPWHCLQ